MESPKIIGKWETLLLSIRRSLFYCDLSALALIIPTKVIRLTINLFEFLLFITQNINTKLLNHTLKQSISNYLEILVWRMQ